MQSILATVNIGDQRGPNILDFEHVVSNSKEEELPELQRGVKSKPLCFNELY